VLDEAFEQAHALACQAARARLRAAVRTGAAVPHECPDLEQEMLMTVWWALRRFDPSRAALRTFVEMVVAMRLLSLLRAGRFRPKLEPLGEYQSMSMDGGPDIEFRIALDRAFASLPGPDRRLAALLTDLSPTEASRALGISRAAVYRAIDRIRPAFAKAGLGPCTNSDR
jgi:RNA polymerase sigma-70 factor (ECF subfamily)